ncbi:MAG: hypothetical protein QOH76_1967, partial [Thermoleophilaceae bacterium]|nr:hypothetical protein [Thermoleophilaceae bacterium]
RSADLEHASRLIRERVQPDAAALADEERDLSTL